MTANAYRSGVKKAITRLVPLMMIVYFMAFVDRTNVGLAKTSLEADVGIGAAAYGLGAGIFFVSYALLEVPSNLILHKVGPRRWIARIAITWGLITSAMMFTDSAITFYILRFLLGAAEAGLYPGLMYVITLWFAQKDRAKIVGLMLVASTSAFMVGNPIGGLIMLLDGVWGMHGWQWLFLVEGIPSVVLGVLIWFRMPDRPTDARWLTADEAATMTEYANRTDNEHIRGSLRVGFVNPIILCVATIYFLNQIATYGAVYFIPAVVESLGVTGSFTIGILAGLVGVGPLIGVIVIPRLLRRYGNEVRLIGLTIFGSIVCCLAFLLLANPAARLVVLGCTMFFITGMLPLFWSVAMARVSGKMAAGVLALINTIGLTGGFVGPYLFGIAEQLTGLASSGFYVLIASSILGLALVPALSVAMRRSRNKVASEPAVLPA